MKMAKFENWFLTPIQGLTQSKIKKAKFFLLYIYLRADLSESSIIIDRSKIRTEREKARNKPDTVFKNVWIWGLSFDGRRDAIHTQFRDVETRTNHRRILREEDITLLKEVGMPKFKPKKDNERKKWDEKVRH